MKQISQCERHLPNHTEIVPRRVKVKNHHIRILQSRRTAQPHVGRDTAEAREVLERFDIVGDGVSNLATGFRNRQPLYKLWEIGRNVLLIETLLVDAGRTA